MSTKEIFCVNCKQNKHIPYKAVRKINYCSETCRREYLGLIPPTSSKICTECKIDLPESSYRLYMDKRSNGVKVVRFFPRCIECDSKCKIAYNKTHYRPYDRKYKIKQTYGIEFSVYEEMFESQHRACAICEILFGGTKGIHIDHNHDTGRIRGLLCSPCNSILGLFNEDIEIMEGACAYL